MPFSREGLTSACSSSHSSIQFSARIQLWSEEAYSSFSSSLLPAFPQEALPLFDRVSLRCPFCGSPLCSSNSILVYRVCLGLGLDVISLQNLVLNFKSDSFIVCWQLACAQPAHAHRRGGQGEPAPTSYFSESSLYQLPYCRQLAFGPSTESVRCDFLLVGSMMGVSIFKSFRVSQFF